MPLYSDDLSDFANSKSDPKSTGCNVICTFCQATTQLSVCFVAFDD